MKALKLGIATCAVAWAIANPAAVCAQEAAESDEAAESQAGLNTIVVTAQRREESSQRAAIAIDVVDSAALEAAQVTSPAQLTNLVPSLQVSRQGGGNVSLFLRGVGTFTANPYTDPAVAFNYDGVYISRPSATTGFFYDVERLEVLKGPQGTLYGRNATGGALNVLPVTPRIGETEGYATASYGNYNSVNLQGAINVAVSEDSALRISGTFVDRDPFNADGTGDEKGYGFRGQFAIEPSSDFRLRIAGDYYRRTGVGTGGTITTVVPFNPFTNSFLFIPTGISPSAGTYGPEGAAVLSSSFSPIAGRTLEPLTTLPSLDGNFWGVSAQADLDTGIGTFTAIAAYRGHSTDDVTSGAGFTVIDSQDLDQYSLELRLAGSAGAVDYIVGGYYYDDQVDGHYVPLTQAVNAYQDFTTTTRSLAAFARLNVNVTDQFRIVGGIRYTDDRKTQVGTSEPFLALCGAPTGQCPGAPLLPFSNTADEVIASLGLLPIPFAPPGFYFSLDPAAANSVYVRSPTNINSARSDGKVTWRAAVEYDVAPASLLYASIETGFRSGGLTFSLARPGYGPESITAYTIGSKNRFLDNRLQLNLEAFYWEYRDQQLSHSGTEADGSPAFFTENVGGSTVKGVELEAQFLVTDNTLIGADIQYLDATNDNFVFKNPATANPVLSTPGNPVYIPQVTGCATSGPSGGLWTVDCSGLQASRAPKWTMMFGFQQTIPLGDEKIILGANTRYQSSNYTGFDQILPDFQKSYWVSNAEVSFVGKDEHYRISLYVNNIENDRVQLGSTYSSPIGVVGASFSDPRTYGVRLSGKF
ncbi:TonB-dependent receptor [Croceibacterium salegens]|nr:TonB-dependent receptor [Croceibacterium salegens]